MATRPFDDSALQDWLAQKDIAILSTLRPDGGPLAMPMWFVHDTGQVGFVSIDALAKVRNLERDPRACIVAEDGVRGAVKGVVLLGDARFCEGEERRAWGRRFLAKYPEVERNWKGPELPQNRRVFVVRAQVSAIWGL